MCEESKQAKQSEAQRYPSPFIIFRFMPNQTPFAFYISLLVILDSAGRKATEIKNLISKKSISLSTQTLPDNYTLIKSNC